MPDKQPKYSIGPTVAAAGEIGGLCILHNKLQRALQCMRCRLSKQTNILPWLSMHKKITMTRIIAKYEILFFPQGLLLMLTMLTVPGACRAAIYEHTGRYVTTGEGGGGE